MLAETRAAQRSISADEWLAVVRLEYLADYLPAGGSAVKFISGSAPVLEHVRRRLWSEAHDRGFYTALLDPAAVLPDGKEPDLHRIERFFFAVTVEADWRAWAARQVREDLRAQGIEVAADCDLSDVDGIAQEHGRDRQSVIDEYRNRVTNEQLRDHGMAVEFRTAVTALGHALLLPDQVYPTTEEVLLAWFAGRTVPGAAAALKRLQIFERITASNARFMLASLCRWLPRAGHAGLVAVLDLRPYQHKQLTASQRQARAVKLVREANAAGASADVIQSILDEAEAVPPVSYSDKAYHQMLSLLRRFIDEVEAFERFLLVVLTTPDFYDIDSRRNYYNYDALQTRIGQEAHDARRANPAAALVHLSEASETISTDHSAHASDSAGLRSSASPGW